MEKIFLGEKDINYNKNRKYAFLNWCFDEGIDRGDYIQKIHANFQMGNTYLSNAVLTLYTIIYVKNSRSIADALIFPVLYDIGHSLELLLKSGILASSYLAKNKKSIKNTHDIKKLKEELKESLSNLGMNKAKEDAFEALDHLSDELVKVNAHFDFARYAFKTSGDYQFYNAPKGKREQWQRDTMEKTVSKSIVPNTCVDIDALYKVLCGIINNFRELIYYLNLCIDENHEPTDEGFEYFMNYPLSYDEEKEETTEEDPIKIIVDFIFQNILL